MPTTSQRVAIASFVRRLDRTVVQRFGSKVLREYKLTRASISRDATTNSHLQRRIVRFANGVEYDVLRKFTCIQMGFSDETFANWDDPSFVTLLAVFATDDELHLMRTGEIRLDIGLALMSVRECAQLHVWHGKPFSEALSDKQFVEDFYHLERLTSGREAKWNELMRSESQREVQHKFATNILHITSINVPGDGANADEWMDFLITVSTMTGFFLLTRMGYSTLKKNDLQKTLDREIRNTRVGDVVDGLLLGVSATAIGMHWNGSHSIDRLPYFWGIHCFYDIFVLDDRRRDVLDEDGLFEIFVSDYLDRVRDAFRAVNATRLVETEANFDDMEKRAALLGAQLVDEEHQNKDRENARTVKRREKKRRRRDKKNVRTKYEDTVYDVKEESAEESAEETDEEKELAANQPPSVPTTASIVSVTMINDIRYVVEDDTCSLVVHVDDEQDDISDDDELGDVSDDELAIIFRTQTLAEILSS